MPHRYNTNMSYFSLPITSVIFLARSLFLSPLSDQQFHQSQSTWLLSIFVAWSHLCLLLMIYLRSTKVLTYPRWGHRTEETGNLCCPGVNFTTTNCEFPIWMATAAEEPPGLQGPSSCKYSIIIHPSIS